MDDPVMVPEWVVLLVGRQALELEALRRRNELLSQVHVEQATDDQ